MRAYNNPGPSLTYPEASNIYPSTKICELWERKHITHTLWGSVVDCVVSFSKVTIRLHCYRTTMLFSECDLKINSIDKARRRRHGAHFNPETLLFSSSGGLGFKVSLYGLRSYGLGDCHH